MVTPTYLTKGSTPGVGISELHVVEVAPGCVSGWDKGDFGTTNKTMLGPTGSCNLVVRIRSVSCLGQTVLLDSQMCTEL